MPGTDERIRVRLRMAGFDPPAAVVSGFAAYVELLARWNRRINLTSLPLEPLGDGAIDRLLVEPYAAAQYIGVIDQSIVDLGSGGGSPGIPMQIAAAGARVVLVESRTKKVAFLREATRQLGLTGVMVENCRFEDLAGRGSYAVSADLVTFRAVRADEDVWRAIDVLLRPEGRAVWFGAPEVVDRAPLPGFRVVSSWVLVPASRARAALLARSAE